MVTMSSQKARFEADIAVRKKLGKPSITADDGLIQALQSGMPDCSGVALGLDRLIMIALNKDRIQEIQSFAVGI
jgi:elongation factor P--(R)-beta-lysine ligase